MRQARSASLTRPSFAALAAALALGIGACTPTASTSEALASSASAEMPEWLAALDAPHRMLFDANSPGTGVALAHTLNWYNGWQAEDGSTDDQINGILTFYGGTTLHGLNDDMWAKYGLGELSGAMDAEGTAYTRNPWRVDPLVLGSPVAPAGIEPLAERGVTFLLCNNALNFWAGQIATARGLDADEVYQDLRTNMLPQATLVPAMVVAIDQAQQAGISYHRQ